MKSDTLQLELLGLLPGRQGHFQLESGHHGNLWLDIDLLFQRPARLQRFAAALAQRFAGLGINAVCGPLVGGAILAHAVAVVLDVEFYYTERVPTTRGGLYSANYRLPDTLRPSIVGKQVAIVDDAINAGSAVRATYLELQASGAASAVVGALFVLGPRAAQLADEWKVPLEGIAYLPNELWRPEDCPLCVSGVPLEDVARLKSEGAPLG